jgi:hypothetical protein
MSRETFALARRIARQLRSKSVPVVLAAVDHAGGSTDRDTLLQSITVMGAAFISAGWKPRVRVPYGRRQWSL